MELQEVKKYAEEKEVAPLAKYIVGKLVELGAKDVKYIDNRHSFNHGVLVGRSKAYEEILDIIRKENKQ